MAKHYFLIFVLGLLTSCANSVEEIDDLVSQYEVYKEVGEKVRIFYSDSAMVKVMISGPTLERYISKSDPKEVFPDGVYVEFLNKSGKPYSWLEGDNAVRKQSDNTIVISGHVKFYNAKNEKLESPELIWDEEEEQVRTDKFVRITQPEKGDTSYGYGFIADQNFTRFEIKKKVQGKFNIEKLKETLE
jgi:LPS export ABC transporter protein LptC